MQRSNAKSMDCRPTVDERIWAAQMRIWAAQMRSSTVGGALKRKVHGLSADSPRALKERIWAAQMRSSTVGRQSMDFAFERSTDSPRALKQRILAPQMRCFSARQLSADFAFERSMDFAFISESTITHTVMHINIPKPYMKKNTIPFLFFLV